MLLFVHKKSQECKYGRTYFAKLCQFQHNDAGDYFHCDVCEFKAGNGEDLDNHNKKDHEFKKFDDMMMVKSTR